MIPAKLSDYQPSAENLKRYLHTGKFGRRSSLPGLIGTHGLALPMFMIALAAEAVGLLLLWNASQFNPMFAVLLFGVDLSLALLAHASARGVCLQRNLILLNDPIDPGSPEGLAIGRLVPMWVKIVTWSGRAGIVGLAVFKGMAMQSYRVPDDPASGPVFLVVILAYIVAAFIHLTYTGDALADMWRGYWCQREKSNYENDLAREHPQHVPGWPLMYLWQFMTEAVLNLTDFGYGGAHHKLALVQEWNKEQGRYVPVVENGKYKYEIITKGTLMDVDITDLFARQGNTPDRQRACSVLRRECISMQFERFLQDKNPREPLKFVGGGN